MSFQDFPTEPNMCELYARFAYLLIERDYRQRVDAYAYPVQAIKALRDRFAPADDVVLDTFLAAYQYLAARGVTMRFARTAMIERARKGLDFRAVAFVDYKAHRRADPRVTNRGVSSSRKRKEQE